MRDCLCFEDHLTNGIDGRNKTLGIAERTPDQVKRLETFRSRPFWYKCNRFAFVGPDVTVQWPAYSSWMRSEEHTSELQSLMRISYAVFCLKKKINHQITHETNYLIHTDI